MADTAYTEECFDHGEPSYTEQEYECLRYLKDRVDKLGFGKVGDGYRTKTGELQSVTLSVRKYGNCWVGPKEHRFVSHVGSDKTIYFYPEPDRPLTKEVCNALLRTFEDLISMFRSLD